MYLETYVHKQKEVLSEWLSTHPQIELPIAPIWQAVRYHKSVDEATSVYNELCTYPTLGVIAWASHLNHLDLKTRLLQSNAEDEFLEVVILVAEHGIEYAFGQHALEQWNKVYPL